MWEIIKIRFRNKKCNDDLSNKCYTPQGSTACLWKWLLDDISLVVVEFICLIYRRLYWSRKKKGRSLIQKWMQIDKGLYI